MSFLRSLWLLLLLLAGWGGSAFADDGEHPDLLKLKIYRSYYSVTLQAPQGQNFEVWYQKKSDDLPQGWEWEHFQANAPTGADLSGLKPEGYMPVYGFVAGWPSPGDNLEPVPAELAGMADGLKAAVKANHAAELFSDDIRVEYLGEGARLFADEIVPIGSLGSDDPARSFARTSSVFYLANLNTGELKDQKIGGSGIGGLRLGGITGPEVKNPNWVDFVLPEDVEGSALFTVGFSDEEVYPERHVAVREDLNKALVEAAKKIAADGSTGVQIEDILAKQGNTQLPPKLKQTLDLRVDIYLRPAGEGVNQEDSHLNFKVPVAKKQFKLERKDEKSGMTIKIVGSLVKKKLKVTVTDKNGKAKSVDFKIAELKNLIVEGDAIAVNGMPHLEPVVEDADSVSFPAEGDFKEIDVYVDSSMYPAALTGE